MFLLYITPVPRKRLVTCRNERALVILPLLIHPFKSNCTLHDLEAPQTLTRAAMIPQPETMAAAPSTGTVLANGVGLILELNVKSLANRISAISLAKLFALKFSCNLKPATCIKLPPLFQQEDPARTLNSDGGTSIRQ
uniref:Uncharacterized protein n=1 Tax=Glossina palpalis gambiensis TaxID=67801 RepID=A0A1B0AMK0_9MUSC